MDDEHEQYEDDGFEEPDPCEICGEVWCDGDCNILADDPPPTRFYDEYGDERDENEDEMPIPIELPPDMIDAIVERCAQAVVAKLEPTAKKLLEGKIEEAWDAGLSARMQTMAETMITEWMDKPRTKTNKYGEPVGQSTTFTEEILDGWKKYASEKVDARGQSSTYGDSSRLQWMINQAGIAPIEKLAKEEVAKISAEAKERIKEAVSGFIAQQLAPRIDLLPASKG